MLQPPLGAGGFALPDEGHFMLPPGPALYKLAEPEPSPPSPPSPLPPPSPRGASGGASAGGAGSEGGAHRPLTLADAVLAFMNTPHPLQTLSEVRAYGPGGSISRFHNPRNYVDALEALLR